MPNKSQETILEAFNRASGTPAVSGAATGGTSVSANQSLTDALTQAAQVINAQTLATSSNTDALVQDTQTKTSSSSGGKVSDVLDTASQFLGGGLSLMPLVSLFSSLFGGGQSQQPAPLMPFTLPPSLSLESTTNYQDVSWGENGMPRAAGSAASAAPQITVQVQAIDSQSFLDHSTEIAQAVRQAMLNMNSLNDVVTSL